MAKTPEDFDYVRFIFSDMFGIARGKLVPRANVRNCITDGLGMYAGAQALGPSGQVVVIKKVEELNYTNAIFKPFPDTLRILPSIDQDSTESIGQILCEASWASGTPLGADPRFVARTQVENLNQMNMTVLSGFEMEFTVVQKSTNIPVFAGSDALNLQILRRNHKFVIDMGNALAKSGIPIEAVHTEYGPGQFEMSLAPVVGVKSADDAFLFRNCVKEQSDVHNLDAYFMAKPFDFSGNNGCHFNHSAISGGSSVFGEDGRKLSQLGRYWLAGLLAHMEGMTALCCPTPNCYRRVGMIWGPDVISWGFDDRLATIRVKTGSKGNVYFENRLPSGVANPYLVFAATIAAGIDGIKRKLELPPAGNTGRPVVPRNLQTALSALEEDQILKESLGSEFIEWYSTIKRNMDFLEFPPEETDVMDDNDLLERERKIYYYL